MDKNEFPDQDIIVDVEGEEYEFNLRAIAERLIIDPNHLDEELEQQAALYLWIASAAANALSNAEDSKHGFEIFVAELEKEIRRDFEGQGVKATEAKVAAEVKGSSEYTERLDDYLSDRRSADMLAVIKEAARMRQYTLIERSRRAYKDDAAASED